MLMWWRAFRRVVDDVVVVVMRELEELERGEVLRRDRRKKSDVASNQAVTTCKENCNRLCENFLPDFELQEHLIEDVSIISFIQAYLRSFDFEVSMLLSLPILKTHSHHCFFIHPPPINKIFAERNKFMASAVSSLLW